MSLKSYLLPLLLCIVIAVGLHLILGILLKPIAAYHAFFISCTIFWSLFSLLVLYLAIKASNSRNLYRFSHLILLTVFLKLFLAMSIVVGYKMIVEPADNFFAVPFILLYIIFTVFETYALLKIGRDSPQ